MALTLNTAATLNRLKVQPNILKSEERQNFAESANAGKQLSEAIDSFFPKLDESPSDGAPKEPGVLRYHTSQGERIQVTFTGDSQKGEYVQEWAGGGFIYTKFDENSIENYQVGPQGANHLHIDRNEPEKSYLEASPQGFQVLMQESAPAEMPKVAPQQLLAKDGLQYAILREGHSDEIADRGEAVMVHYTGWLQNGESFDSSRNRDKPFTFPLGQGRVIQGWEKGVEGMRVGEKRLLDIPAHLAYGERATGTIPPNSPLLFEVELLATSGQLVTPKPS